MGGVNWNFKVLNREICSWESILLKSRLERKKRLELCLRSARLEDWRDEELEGQGNNHAEDKKY